MLPDRQEDHIPCAVEAEHNTIPPINAKAPHPKLRWLQLLGVKRWVRWVAAKIFNVPYRLPLDTVRQFTKTTLETTGQEHFHTRYA